MVRTQLTDAKNVINESRGEKLPMTEDEGFGEWSKNGCLQKSASDMTVSRRQIQFHERSNLPSTPKWLTI